MAMTFENLPDDWADQPISTPGLIADVVDLFLRDSDRDADSILALLCDDRGRVLAPIVFGDVEWLEPEREGGEFFSSLAEAPTPQAVFAISSRWPIPEALALRWRRTAERILGPAGVDVVGFFSACPGRVWAVEAAA